MNYSRYVDDYEIYIYNDDEKQIVSIVGRILKKYGFTLNYEKTEITEFPYYIAENLKKIIEKYQCETKKVFKEDYTLKLKEPTTIIRKQEYKAQRRDIDINKHIHNLYYLDYAYEVLPEEVYEAPECNNIEIMYKTDTIK